jgi:hypothetical protein
MATNAERQRRFRAHRRDDHSLCSPERCDSAVTTPSVTSVTGNAPASAATTGAGREPPKGLRARGKRVWRELVDGGSPGPAEVLLIEEACRLSDRLDRLDAILNGRDRAWLQLEVSDDGTEITVIVDKCLSEARQQAVALKQLLGEIRQMASGKAAGAPMQAQEVSFRDQLAARRAQRLADAASS